MGIVQYVQCNGVWPCCVYVVCVRARARMLFVLVAVAACWCILAMRPDYARFRL